MKPHLRLGGAKSVMSLLRLRGTGGGGSTYAPCTGTPCGDEVSSSKPATLGFTRSG